MQALLNRSEKGVLPDGPTVMSACFSTALSVCAWSACLSAWFPLYLLLSLYPSAYLTVNSSFLFDRPCLISPTITATLAPHFITGPYIPESLPNIFLPISLHIIFSCLQRNWDSWLSFIPLIHRVAEANLQGTRQRLFVKLLFISFIKSSSSPIKEPRTVALDSHITLVSFGEMIYCLI